MSESCLLCSAILTARQQRRKKSAIQCSHTIKRYAFDINGTIGSVYDCWIDKPSYTSTLDKNFITEEELKTAPRCYLLNDDVTDDFLNILNIDEDLWVSIVLGMTPVTNGMGMLYNYQIPHDYHVHFLHYYTITRECHMFDDTYIIKRLLPKILENKNATHIIKNIDYGIEFIIAVEFSHEQNWNETHLILDKICKYFTGKDQQFLSMQEQNILNQLTPRIFSQIQEISSYENNKNFSEICQNIHQYLFEQKRDIPMFYTLHSVKISDSNKSLDEGIFSPLNPSVTETIRKVVLKLFNKLKVLENWFDEIQSSSISNHLQNRYNYAFDKLNAVKNSYKTLQSDLANIVVKLRQGKADPSSFEKRFNKLQHEDLDDELERLEKRIHKLRTKARLITDLENHGLQYFNTADLEGNDDNEQTLERKLLQIHDQPFLKVLCSSDELIKKDNEQHQDFCQQLQHEKETNPSLHLVFADFSYCKFKLLQMHVLSKSPEPSIPTATTDSSIETKELNILLLGETGIGKTTFINALVNYLAFETIENAEENKPIILIPVSFIMTDDDLYNEHEIRQGDPDNSNEDFNHPGQTITQNCQSYLFNLDHHTKLRLIDTPGIGDTRGVSQDDKNIQYILSYINNLSHLNAICILLKPNVSRIHVLFRSCLEQIFNFLGPNARDNILFCFTNSRSTFFVPGTTGSLLKKMLSEFPENQTPQLNKSNMFCFDNESFRYLVAIKARRKVQFNDQQKQDYITSWNKSVCEVNRFINSIQLRPDYQMNIWHSSKHAQLIILSLIQPIVETLRYILRGKLVSTITFQAESISKPGYLCTTCPFTIKKIDSLSIVKHTVHYYEKDQCDACQCENNKHLSILYQLKYDGCAIENNRCLSKTRAMRDELVQASITFALFLIQTVQMDEDLFLPWFNLFIQEEDFICSQDSTNMFNGKIHELLMALKDEYQKRLHAISHSQESIDIEQIYECIEKVQTYPIINEQICVIKESHMKMMYAHEHDVSSQYPNINISQFLSRLTNT